MEKRQVEILAPAGSFDSMKAAVAAGADAVYMGGSRFGARAYADNPDEKGLLEAIDYVHLHGRRLYMTVNTLFKEDELELFDFNHNSLYEVLKSFYQLSFTKARQILNATVGSSEIYGYLETEQNQPLLRINAASFCLYHDNETVFEIYESYILTDILSYYVEKYNT